MPFEASEKIANCISIWQLLSPESLPLDVVDVGVPRGLPPVHPEASVDQQVGVVDPRDAVAPHRGREIRPGDDFAVAELLRRPQGRPRGSLAAWGTIIELAELYHS